MDDIQIIMQHDEKSIRRLAKMQYQLFGNTAKTLVYFIGIVMMLAAIDIFPNSLSQGFKYVMLAGGCFLILSTGYQPAHNANRIIEAIKKSGHDYPGSAFIFGEESFQVSANAKSEKPEKEMFYANLKGLGEDDAYYYLFISSSGGYMIPKEAMSPEQRKRFCDSIEKCAGKHFLKPSAGFLWLLRNLTRRRS